jgi:hypothetical protein
MTRKITAALLLALGGTMLWAGLSEFGRTQEKKPAARSPFVHAVIIPLKKDAPEGEADALIADAKELLGSIPSVRGLRAGKPVEKGPGDFVQKDYQVGLVLGFDDAEGLKAYLEHPQHLKYVERHIKNVDTEHLRVFDFAEPQAK